MSALSLSTYIQSSSKIALTLSSSTFWSGKYNWYLVFEVKLAAKVDIALTESFTKLQLQIFREVG
nr:hypothetical protein [Hufsiella ginkgonis]